MARYGEERKKQREQLRYHHGRVRGGLAYLRRRLFGGGD